MSSLEAARALDPEARRTDADEGTSGEELPMREVRRASRSRTVRESFRSHFLLRGGNGNGPAIALAHERAGSGEADESLAEALVADAKLGAKLRAAERTVGAREPVEEEAVEIARRIVGRAGLDVVEDLEMRAVGLLIAGDEAKA